MITNYRFTSRQEYTAWLESMVTRIYYAQIAMNSDCIRDVVTEIGSKLWLQEGVELYPTGFDSFHCPQFEAGDLIEDLDIESLDHAEKFLLATRCPVDGSIELRCGNGNRWAPPKNHKNHGNVVSAYATARKAINK